MICRRDDTMGDPTVSGVGGQEPVGRREVKRGTGRRREDAACFSGARVEGERTREGQGWPRTGMGEGTLPPTREEVLARLPFPSISLISITEILTFTAKA